MRPPLILKTPPLARLFRDARAGDCFLTTQTPANVLTAALRATPFRRKVRTLKGRIITPGTDRLVSATLVLVLR